METNTRLLRSRTRRFVNKTSRLCKSRRPDGSYYFYDGDDSVSQTLTGRLVTPNWLTTLGIEPLVGRNFRAEEQIIGQDAVVMLSYRCWRTRFRSDPHIVGKTYCS